MIDDATLLSEVRNSSITGRTRTTREESDVDNEQQPRQDQDENVVIRKPYTRIFALLAFTVVILAFYGFYQGGKDAQREECKSLKLEFIKDKVAFLCMQSRYKDATHYLDQLTSQQGNVVLSVSLELRIAECYTQQGRNKKAEEVLRATRLVLMPSLSLSDEVRLSAKYLMENKFFIRAIFFLRIASGVYKSDTSSPDISVDEIANCLEKVYDAFITMLELGSTSNIFAKDHALRYMLDILDDLRTVENADPAFRSRSIARCMGYIGRVYYQTKEYKKSIEFHKNGIKLLEQTFGLINCSKFFIYGLLLTDVGHAYNGLAKYDREDCISQELCKIASYNMAENYFEKSVRAFEKAIDCNNDAAKKKLIEYAKSHLRHTNEVTTNEMHKKRDFYLYESGL